MTASSLLADLCDRGVRLRLSEDRLRILIPKAVLTPDLRASLLSVKPQLIRMIELVEQYRELLREGVIAEDGDEARRQFADHQARLVDELGPKLAGAVGAMEGRREDSDDSACPRCEGRGQCQECGNTPEN
jgi:hypothetical protein